MGRGLLLSLVLAVAGQQPTPTHAPPSVVARAHLHDSAGWQALEHGDPESAVREFAAAVRINPEYADALYGMGKAYMALQRYDVAAAAFERCREVYRKTGSSGAEWRMLRNRERESRLRDLRQEAFNLLNTPQPEEKDVIADRVRQIQEQIRTLEGQKEPGPIIEPPAPVPAFVSLSLGSAWFRLDRLGDAERMFREAIMAKDDFGEARSNLALVLLVTGRPREAQQQIVLAEESGFPVNPELKRRVRAALGKP